VRDKSGVESTKTHVDRPGYIRRGLRIVGLIVIAVMVLLFWNHEVRARSNQSETSQAEPQGSAPKWSTTSNKAGTTTRFTKGKAAAFHS
jgi:hypothetical protein